VKSSVIFVPKAANQNPSASAADVNATGGRAAPPESGDQAFTESNQAFLNCFINFS
jgi:hypothetical protein